ncbi:hypothetical protein GJ496_008992 [Pomphorhynchus laevis]|nr:hypothetical protein GJ496_008992 [Pomphorhynchus laevis]
MKSNDLVRLEVNHVKHKKRSGTLRLLLDSLEWTDDDNPKERCSIPYGAIKVQRISPEFKIKKQLQIVRSSDESTVNFHFDNPSGVEAQEKDREQPILKENPAIAQLFKDLVQTNIKSSEEFWNEYVDPNLFKGDFDAQRIGIDGSFLSRLKPLSNSVNGTTYNLSTDVIECIFRVYPEVKRSHLDSVPCKMSEEEFWSNFFRSRYLFNLKSLEDTSDDIFAKSAEAEAEAIRKDMLSIKEMLCPISDRLDAFDADNEYGKSTTSHANSLIKRFNFHSIKLLGSSDNVDEDYHFNKHLNKSSKNKEDHFDFYVHHPNQYFERRVTATNARHACSEFYFVALKIKIHDWNLDKEQIRRSLRDGTDILTRLNLSNHQEGTFPNRRLLMESLKKENPEYFGRITEAQSSVKELLRHFWHCFPITSPALRDKRKRLIKEMHSLKDHVFPQLRLDSLKSRNKRFPKIIAELEHLLDVALNVTAEEIKKLIA